VSTEQQLRPEFVRSDAVLARIRSLSEDECRALVLPEPDPERRRRAEVRAYEAADDHGLPATRVWLAGLAVATRRVREVAASTADWELAFDLRWAGARDLMASSVEAKCARAAVAAFVQPYLAAADYDVLWGRFPS
jgi:hypothetical protein